MLHKIFGSIRFGLSLAGLRAMCAVLLAWVSRAHCVCCCRNIVDILNYLLFCMAIVVEIQARVSLSTATDEVNDYYRPHVSREWRLWNTSSPLALDNPCASHTTADSCEAAVRDSGHSMPLITPP